MPVVTVETPALAAAVKRALITSLTRAAAEATGYPEASFIVIIRETPADAIGIGGVPLSERRG